MDVTTSSRRGLVPLHDTPAEDHQSKQDHEEVENNIRYCCCFTESQIKLIGRITGIVLLIAGVVGLVFAALAQWWFLVAATSLYVIGGGSLIYFSQQFEGLSHEVDRLATEVNKTKAVADKLGSIVMQGSHNNARLGKEIDRLKEARKLIVEDLIKALHDIEQTTETLTTIAQETEDQITKGLEERMKRFHDGIDTELRELHQGSAPFIALTESLADLQHVIDDLRRQLAEKDTEIARLQKLVPSKPK